MLHQYSAQNEAQNINENKKFYRIPQLTMGSFNIEKTTSVGDKNKQEPTVMTGAMSTLTPNSFYNFNHTKIHKDRNVSQIIQVLESSLEYSNGDINTLPQISPQSPVRMTKAMNQDENYVLNPIVLGNIQIATLRDNKKKGRFKNNGKNDQIYF